MISSAQALSSARSRALPPLRRRRVVPTRSRSQKYPALGAGILGLIGLLAFILTHMSTYTVTFVHSSTGQTDVQTSIQSRTQPVTQNEQATTKASGALIRFNQTSLSQYADQAEHDLWEGSTCSTASMAEVLNSYGYHYRITDVLQVEQSIHAITAESGLLYPAGIDDTALRFGFLTTTLQNPTVGQVIATAQKGRPVIVNFPPHAWSTRAPEWTAGHFLVVIDGTASTVQLADSWTTNKGTGLQKVSYEYFQTYWHGFAKVLTPSPYMITHKPTVSVEAINAMLDHYHSPVAGQGRMIYDEAVQYGLDPAYIMATFGHESTFGTRGEATKSLSPGNLRCIATARCADGYAQFDSWQAGFDALCALVAGSLYARDHRIIPELIIPRFAPAADRNDEQAYMTSLEHTMDVLRAGGTQI